MAQCTTGEMLGEEGGEEGKGLVEKENATVTQHQVFFRAVPLVVEKLEKFQIVFHNPSATYFAGETVCGYGWIVLKEALYVQSICLEAIGEAKVEWMTSSDIQASDEEVFNHTAVLPIKGEKQINDEGMLHPGSHYFPFEFTLPAKLPSSFKDKHGRLRYYVRMTVYTQGLFTPGSLHTERTSKFAVIGALDLNSEPDASLPVENDTFETVGSWCCVAGTVTAMLRLERKGFVVKEAIPVWAQIRNLSARTIRRTMVSLVQNVTYYSYRGRFTESTVLVTMYKGSVAPRAKQTWNRELISVPTVPPSHLRGCKIIDIQYSIELCIKPAGLARRIKLPVDIIIGTVPLRERQHRVTCHPLTNPTLGGGGGADPSSSFPFPFFTDATSDQVFLSDMSFHNMVPTAPPWEEDDDIP
ncbi:hypothetical protein ACOMHN_025554 [Nucella lapillus]